MILSALAKLVAPSRASGDLYELSDILRESLESPIPESPRTGWQPYSERTHQLPAARLPRSSQSLHADLEEYHADDELSELRSATHTNPETLSGVISAREERSGLTPVAEGNSSGLSSFSYYYYLNPDFTPESLPSDVPSSVKRGLLCEREQEVLPAIEALSRADEWRQEVVDVQSLIRHAESPTPSQSQSSVYQLLHDTPVESTNTINAIRTWQGDTAMGSLDTPKLPPPSFMESFQPKNGLDDGEEKEEALFDLSEEAQACSDAESATSYRPTASLVLEERAINLAEEFDKDCPATAASRGTYEAGLGIEHRASPSFAPSLHRDPAKALADLSDYQAVFRKIRGDTTARPEQITHRLQRLTALLNQRQATVEELRSFWEVQK